MRDYTKIEKKNCQLVAHYGGKKFNFPRGVAIGPNDDIVIVDRDDKKVKIFDKDLKLIRTFGQDSGDNKLNNPVGVAVGHNVIAVSEYSDHVVKLYSLQGDYQSKFGSRGSGDGQFNGPQGLCFNSKGLLYVVDNGNCRVQVFRENVFLYKFVSKGRQFLNQYPHHIAIDSNDQVYVTNQCDDDDDGDISVFSEDGHFIKRINCNNPYAICIAPDDHIIVSVNNDYSIAQVAVFSPTHECIAKFGMYGKEKGQFNFITGIAINNSGTIFVTDGNYNNRLQIITI